MSVYQRSTSKAVSEQLLLTMLLILLVWRILLVALHLLSHFFLKKIWDDFILSNQWDTLTWGCHVKSEITAYITELEFETQSDYKMSLRLDSGSSLKLRKKRNTNIETIIIIIITYYIFFPSSFAKFPTSKWEKNKNILEWLVLFRLLK